jgi:hypothetical protein
VEAVRATADTLQATLGQMKAVEEIRRAIRDVRDQGPLDPN